MRIRHKLILGYLVVALLVAVVGAVALRSTSSTRRAFALVENDILPTIEALDQLRIAGLRIVASTSEFGFIAAERQAIEDGGRERELRFDDDDDEGEEEELEGRDKPGGDDEPFEAEETEENLIGEAKERYDEAWGRYERLSELQGTERDANVDCIKIMGLALLQHSDRIIALKDEGVRGHEVLEAKEEFEHAEKRFLDAVGEALERKQAEFKETHAAITTTLAADRHAIFLTSCLTLAAGIAFGLTISHFLTRSISRLIHVVTTVQQRKFELDPPTYSSLVDELRNRWLSDETAALNAVFVEMIDQLKDYRAQVESHNHLLEKTVEERTQDLLDARDAAEAASRAKSQFLANMSHEIRTPLNGVVGMLGLLDSSELSAAQQKYTRIARLSASALMSVINDVLDFSKIEAGKLELEHAPFDLSVTLRESIDILSEAARKKDLVLTLALSPDTPSRVFGDANRLKQILVNLVNNAIKFTREGSVAVAVETLENDNAHALIRCSVADTGPGIAADRLGRLFKSFSQIDDSNTRQHGGTGLGLAISKQLATLMGGQIGVESTPGQGSTFWFTARLETSAPSGEAQ